MSATSTNPATQTTTQAAEQDSTESAPLTRRERLRIYDAGMRKKSAAHAATGKGPLPRADYALLVSHTMETVILVWTQGKRLHAMVTGTMPTDLAGATRVDELVCHPAHYPVVCADRATRKRLAQALGSNPSLPHLEVRARQYEASVPYSAWVADLTQHLAHTYWTPKGRDAADVTGWASAFGIPVPSGGVDGAVMARLLDRLPRTSIQGATKSGPESYRAQAIDMEARASRAYAYGRLGGKCEAHTFAERRTEIVEAIQSIDTLLVERNLIAGSIAKAYPVKIAGVSKIHLVEGGLSFDREVVVFGECTHPDAAFAGRAVIAQWRGLEVNPVGETLGMLGWRKRQEHLAAALHQHSRSHVYVAKAAFLGQTPTAPRGVDIDTAKRVKRDMPVEVLLAGAPTD